MTKNKSTKRALLLSVLSLLLCISMLIGTTYAWFTDTVTSAGNIITAGNLKVEMYWADGDEDPTAAAWNDASKGAIFNYELWEPGYTQARHIKVANVGNLALKYQMRILANGIVSKLADVIDVYYFEDATQLTRASLTEAKKLGTLAEVLKNNTAFEVENGNSLSSKITGELEAGTVNNEDTVTIALKMQESAGNEYQGLSIGTDFSVQLLATQLTSESDTFDKLYDEDADFAPQTTPSAMVSSLNGEELDISFSTDFGGSASTMTLDAGYQFEPTETYEQALESEYANAHADFYIKADQDVKAGSLAVAGYYNLFCEGFNNGNWVALTAGDVAANTPIRLIADGMNGGKTDSGITVPYSLICQYGNDGTGFCCGIVDLDGSNAGTTVTVELRLYQVKDKAESTNNSWNEETGEFITIGTFTYTFPLTVDAYEVEGVEVQMTSKGYNSITYHDRTNYTDKVQAIDVYAKEDLVAALELRNAGVFVHNGSNDIHPVINIMSDIDFGGDSFAGFGNKVYINGNGHTISNIKFVANAGGKAGLLNYAGDNIIKDLTIKDASVAGAQAGIFAGNAANVHLENCALEGNITVTWEENAAEAYNGVGAAFGVIASESNSLDVDVTNATITIEKTGITYAAGKTAETATNLVGVVYGGTYTIG